MKIAKRAVVGAGPGGGAEVLDREGRLRGARRRDAARDGRLPLAHGEPARAGGRLDRADGGPGRADARPGDPEQIRDLAAKGFAGTVFLITDDCRPTTSAWPPAGSSSPRRRNSALRDRRRLPRSVRQRDPTDPGDDEPQRLNGAALVRGASRPGRLSHPPAASSASLARLFGRFDLVLRGFAGASLQSLQLSLEFLALRFRRRSSSAAASGSSGAAAGLLPPPGWPRPIRSSMRARATAAAVAVGAAGDEQGDDHDHQDDRAEEDPDRFDPAAADRFAQLHQVARRLAFARSGPGAAVALAGRRGGALGGVDVFGPPLAVPPAQPFPAWIVVPAGRYPRPARRLGRVHAAIMPSLGAELVETTEKGPLRGPLSEGRTTSD